MSWNSQPELSSFNLHYKLVKRLGSGGFGDVYKCISRSSGKVYAAKILERVCRLTYSEPDQCHIPDEVIIMRELHHDSIIRYHNVFNDSGTWIILMEYLAGFEDIQQYLKRKDMKLDEVRTASIISQLLVALRYLTKKGIDHRDIKSENILFNPKTKQIKLIDFGCSSRISSSPYRTLRGTELYYPPEWFDRREFTSEAGTVWAVGVLTYILLVGRTPFPSLADRRVYQHKINWRGITISPLGKKFIKRCLRMKSSERWSFAEMDGSKWLQLSCFV